MRLILAIYSNNVLLFDSGLLYIFHSIHVNNLPYLNSETVCTWNGNGIIRCLDFKDHIIIYFLFPKQRPHASSMYRWSRWMATAVPTPGDWWRSSLSRGRFIYPILSHRPPTRRRRVRACVPWHMHLSAGLALVPCQPAMGTRRKYRSRARTTKRSSSQQVGNTAISPSISFMDWIDSRTQPNPTQSKRWRLMLIIASYSTCAIHY